MFFEFSKGDLLNIGQATAWPYYANLADVPKEWKDEVKFGSNFHLMVVSNESVTGISGIYAWDGKSWHTVALGYEPSGTTAQRPTAYNTGRKYYDTTLSRPIWWSGTGWKFADGSDA